MKNIFKNCIRVEQTPEGYLPYRFTENQIDFYLAESRGAWERAVSQAGICMSFVTDLPEISFDFENLAFSRPFVCFDIYENDVFAKPCWFEDDTVCGTVRYTRRERQASKITIYLPCMVQSRISNISIGDYAPADDQSGHLLALGDSVTQGMNGICPSQNYVAVAARNLGFDLLNQGVGGQPFNQNSFDPALPYRPDIITVAFGANDFNIEPQAEIIYQNALEHLRKVREFAQNVPVFVISPVWRFDIAENPELHQKASQLNAYIENAAREHGCTYVHGPELVPHDEMFFSKKNLHPCDLGFVNYGDNLSKLIAERD